jgi:hypothetical protein
MHKNIYESNKVKRVIIWNGWSKYYEMEREYLIIMVTITTQKGNV